MCVRLNRAPSENMMLGHGGVSRVIVAQPFERLFAPLPIFERRESDHDVQNRFGAHPSDGGRAIMFDPLSHGTQGKADARPLLDEIRLPLRIVVDE